MILHLDFKFSKMTWESQTINTFRRLIYEVVKLILIMMIFELAVSESDHFVSSLLWLEDTWANHLIAFRETDLFSPLRYALPVARYITTEDAPRRVKIHLSLSFMCITYCCWHFGSSVSLRSLLRLLLRLSLGQNLCSSLRKNYFKLGIV